MADVSPTPDGGMQVTVSAAETSGLKALVAAHLPFLKRAASWFERDAAPELGEAAAFLESLAAAPPEGSTLAVSASQAQHLRGLLQAHVGEFQAVLAIVDSPAVRSLLALAKALL